ncbi:MAG: UDP-N-acetylglucosamine 1-carboxyvinyltransferase [candidate division WOR-3 bacterium]|nr:UDP-N-acetylglucosamine 1-carboxyvinyltransferase [candidate division WOR-3 bacterium]
MDKLLIRGGNRLQGRVKISGAKNATLPLLAACLLTDKPCIIKEAPLVQDIKTMVELLKSLGAEVKIKDNDITVWAKNKLVPEAPYEIVSKMRASYYVLGPLLSRFGEARVYLPGGCAIGPRPIDLHIKGMQSLGANIKIEHGYIDAHCTKLSGTEIFLEGNMGPSVGATANVMMAATLAKAETTIIGAALEPEIVDLANFLNSLGAKIEGAGTSRIKIQGVDELNGGEWTPIPDRIEAGTFACAAVITKGTVEIDNCYPEHLDAVLLTLKNIGCEISFDSNLPTQHRTKTIKVKAPDLLKPVNIDTAPYPGFPTDLQAQFMAVLTVADGTSIITENIFQSRFLHALELSRMGANIEIKNNTAIIKGVKKLTGAQVMASDLRASAALVLAGLCAEGETEVARIYHLDRGYENLEIKLKNLGASVQRVKA